MAMKRGVSVRMGSPAANERVARRVLPRKGVEWIS